MSDRVVFGIVTAKENPATVLELVDALGPSQPVVIHHDFGKQANFSIDRCNVHIIPDYVETGWGTWGLVRAIKHVISVAFRRHRFDYFQLLSGSCMPLRPMAEFEAFVRNGAAEANIGLCNLLHDPVARMSHGFRAYAPAGSLRHRVLRRTREWYFSGRIETTQREGLGIWQRQAEPDGAQLPLRARIALGVMAAAERGLLFSHPFHDGLEPYIGSTWFGCSASVCEYIVNRPLDDAFERYCKRIHLPDEMYLPTLIGNSGCRIGPSNHAINEFEGPHPRWIEPEDVHTLLQTGRFFARKFSNDPNAPGRVELRRLLARGSEPARGKPVD